MNDPNLLFLAHTVPFPPDEGAKIRTFNIFRLLSRQFRVDALCFCRDPKHATAVDMEERVVELRRYGSVESFAIPQESSIFRRGWDHLRSVATELPYTRYMYESRDFRSRLRELLEHNDYDLIHVDSMDLSAYLPALTDQTVICGHHNVESELLFRRARSGDNLFKRLYLLYQARLLEIEEERWCPRVELNVTVSERDRKKLTGRIPEADAMVVPNGVDTDAYRPNGGEKEGGLVFVGGCDWFPNRDALAHFAEEILPQVRSRRPEVTVTWIGRADQAMRSRYRRRHGIEMTGYVKDIRPHVHRAACYVVPIRVGGGSRLKILDAWAMGKAVVSTSQGCEGLDAVDGENILVRDRPEAFAEAINRVLSDECLRRRLGRRARKTAEEKYSWEVVGAEMNRTYRELADSSGPSAGVRCG